MDSWILQKKHKFYCILYRLCRLLSRVLLTCGKRRTKSMYTKVGFHGNLILKRVVTVIEQQYMVDGFSFATICSLMLAIAVSSGGLMNLIVTSELRLWRELLIMLKYQLCYQCLLLKHLVISLTKVIWKCLFCDIAERIWTCHSMIAVNCGCWSSIKFQALYYLLISSIAWYISLL